MYYYHHYFYNRIRGFFGIVILYKKNCMGGHLNNFKGLCIVLYFCRGGPFLKNKIAIAILSCVPVFHGYYYICIFTIQYP